MAVTGAWDGGQLIAALVNNPDLLVFDEAHSISAPTTAPLIERRFVALSRSMIAAISVLIVMTAWVLIRGPG